MRRGGTRQEPHLQGKAQHGLFSTRMRQHSHSSSISTSQVVPLRRRQAAGPRLQLILCAPGSSTDADRRLSPRSPILSRCCSLFTTVLGGMFVLFNADGCAKEAGGSAPHYSCRPWALLHGWARVGGPAAKVTLIWAYFQGKPCSAVDQGSLQGCGWST